MSNEMRERKKYEKKEKKKSRVIRNECEIVREKEIKIWENKEGEKIEGKENWSRKEK